jgi:hypothetical protein
MSANGDRAALHECLLDEQPYYLVPANTLARHDDAPLIVNPDCWFRWHGPLPADKARRLTNLTALADDPQVWVRDAGTDTVWPYWVGDEFMPYLAPLSPGSPMTRQLPPMVEWVLRGAEILVEPSRPAWRRSEWLRTAAASQEQFHTEGYAAVSGLLPPFHLGALRRYYRYHTRIGSFKLGDQQVERRQVKHNETLARFFHAQLAGAVSDLVGTVVKPSFVYVAAYESGAKLAKHLDRPQCQYSITLSIDATPEPDGASPWPIRLETPDGAVSFYQSLGDALLFQGTRLPHFRDELEDGCTSTSMLFFYVDDAFDGPLN